MRVHITGINENMMKQYYWHGEEKDFFLAKDYDMVVIIWCKN